jgi:hypothetical protein
MNARPVIVAASFAPERRTLPLPSIELGPGEAMRDLLEQKKARVEAEELVLEPYGVAWLATAAR